MSQTLEAEANIAGRLIDHHVQANLGHKRAIEYGDKHYSYYDLAALANRAGNLLKGLGLRPGDRVLLLLPLSPAYVGALTGALKAGFVPTLLERPEDAQAVLASVKATQPAAALVHAVHLSAALEPLKAIGADKIIVVGEAPAGHPSFVELMRAQPSSLAAEALSSGAPGIVVSRAEGALTLSHAELDALLDAQGDSGLGRTAEVLRALAKAETAELR